MAILVATGVRIPIDGTSAYLSLGLVETNIVVHPWMKGSDKVEHKEAVKQTVASTILKARLKENRSVVVDVLDYSWSGEEIQTAILRQNSKVKVTVLALTTLLYTAPNEKIVLSGLDLVKSNTLMATKRVKMDNFHSLQVVPRRRMKRDEGTFLSQESPCGRMSAEYVDELRVFIEVENPSRANALKSTSPRYHARCPHCEHRIPLIRSHEVGEFDAESLTQCCSRKKQHVKYLIESENICSQGLKWCKQEKNGVVSIDLKYTR